MSGNRKIDTAFGSYLSGNLDGWDLLTIVQGQGYSGFAVTAELSIVLY